MSDSLGKQIKAGREKKFLTQAGFANKVKMDIMSVRNWEDDKYVPSPKSFAKICQILDMDPLELLPNDYDKGFGYCIKAARVRNGFSQQEMASLLPDVPDSSVSRWERGASMPREDVAKEIKAIFGIDVSKCKSVYVLDEESKESEESKEPKEPKESKLEEKKDDKKKFIMHEDGSYSFRIPTKSETINKSEINKPEVIQEPEEEKEEPSTPPVVTSVVEKSDEKVEKQEPDAVEKLRKKLDEANLPTGLLEYMCECLIHAVNMIEYHNWKEEHERQRRKD